MEHTRIIKYPHSEVSYKEKQRIRIKNAIRNKKKLIITLPTHLARKDMHELLRDSITNINKIDEVFTYCKYEDFIINIINSINITLNEVNNKYNYIVNGPSSWNEYYSRLTPLSEYELSALKRLNYDLFYFVNNHNKDALINKNKQIYDELKIYIENFKEYKEIRSKLKDPSKLTQHELTNLGLRKTSLEVSNNIFINIEIKLRESLNDKAGGITFYITDVDKNITPGSKHVFRPIKKYEVSLVIYKKDSDTTPNEKFVSIIPKQTGLFKKQVFKTKKAVSLKPAKVRKPEPTRTQPTRTQPSRSSKKGGSIVRVGQDANILFKKNIFSFNICHDPTFDPQRINHMLINPDSTSNPLHYLNKKGLYILYQQQIKNLFIYAGEYNTSSIREKIFNKISLESLNDREKQNKLSSIAWSYYTIFYNSIYYNESVFIKLLDNFLKVTTIGNFVNNLEIEIIEKFRPYINGCIININSQLQEIPEFNNDIGILVAGGDSIRRYKNDITQTKDIDTKIHIPLQYQTEANIKKILLILLENMFNLCSYFIIFKQHIFTEQIKIFQLNHGSNIYNVEFILYNTDPNKDLSNFKFRQIYKDKFPVDLFSLDYKCEAFLSVTDGGITKKLPFDFEISFLDIVVEMLTDNQSYYKKNAALSNNNLPVSTIDFLIEDLTKTYNSIKSSSLRFLSGKIEKDHVRYDELIRLKSLPADIKPFAYINEQGSIIPKIIDNDTLSNFDILKSQREQLDNIIIIPTENDKRNIELIKDYEELAIFLKSYYDITDIKRSKILISYEIDGLKKLLDEQNRPRGRARTRNGGLAIFKTHNKGYIEGFNKDIIIPQIKKLQISEKKRSNSSYSKQYKGLLEDELLKSLVINNNLLRSYALYIDFNEYDDLYINCEAEILEKAEYIIFDNNIIKNEKINEETIDKYKFDFYIKINDFFKLFGITTIPKYQKNKDLYEINWNGDINISLLRKYIDKYGGSSFYYELE